MGAAVRFWEVYNGDVDGQGPRLFGERLSLLLQGHRHVHLSRDLANQPLSRRHIARIVRRGGQDFNLRLNRASVAGICRRSSRPSNFAGCSDTQTVTEITHDLPDRRTALSSLVPSYSSPTHLATIRAGPGTTHLLHAIPTPTRMACLVSPTFAYRPKIAPLSTRCTTRNERFVSRIGCISVIPAIQAVRL